MSSNVISKRREASPREAATRLLVINADDLGICESTNRAIAEAHEHGVLTSASLMANGPAFEHAIEEVVRGCPRLGVGLHVCLTSGTCLSSPEDVPLLVDEQGRFRNGFLSLYRLTLTRRKAVIDQLEREITAQFEKLRAHGVAIDHVDSHRHVHMIPVVFEITARLARRFGCPAIRVSHEPFPAPSAFLHLSYVQLFVQNAAKKILLSTLARKNRRHATNLCTARYTFGILRSGKMDVDALSEAIARADHGWTEIVTHPGTSAPPFARELTRQEQKFLENANRWIEASSLADDATLAEIERSACRIVSFSWLVQPEESALQPNAEV